MEPLSLAQLVARRWPLIILITALVVAAAWWKDSQKDPRFFGSMTVTVQASRSYPATEQLILQGSQSEDLQAAIATTQGWIADPYYARKTLEQAGVSAEGRSLKELSTTFEVVTPVAFSSSYQVQYTSTSAAEVEKVFDALRTVLTEAREAYASRQGELAIQISYTDDTVTSKSSGIPLTPIAGLLAGLVLALVVAAAYDRSARA